MVKQEFIVEAAIKRFSHFGINKTTLTEVAEDLSISKQTLLYYFSDKQHLIAAVENQILNEYVEVLKSKADEAESIEAALIKMIEVRMLFYKKYFMLADQFDDSDNITTKPTLAEAKSKFRATEALLLSDILAKGVDEGSLKPMDVRKTARLLLDVLSAFAHYVKEKKVLPQPEDFQELYEKQKEVLHIFYNGLKA